MAGDWRGVQSGLVSGYEVGRASGGKRAGIGAAIGKVANKLKMDRMAGEGLEREKNLLGFEGTIKERLLEKEASLAPTTQSIVGPTGEVVGERPVGSVFAQKEAGGLSKTAAIKLLSDPVQSENLKETYPDLYAAVENAARDTKSTKTPKPIGARVKVVDASGTEFTIPKSQLQQALDEGYRRKP